MLDGKNILVGVTGSIAIYKTLELIRLYTKAKANVRVIMTQSAKKFITPLTFETLTQNKVLCEESEDWTSDFNHIAIGKWADIFVIAPVTANTINKLSNGLADNFLTQSALAYPRIKLLCPAANTNMIENPLTKASLKMLKLCNYKVIEPIIKELACKDVGTGAMADIETIYYQTCHELLKDDYWINRKVVVSGGGTIERIDDVRYLSNFSSGKMASNLALALFIKGADVCLVSSRGHEWLPKNIHIIEVESSNEMKEYLIDSIRIAKKGVLTNNTLMDNSRQELILKKPYIFMASAVSDYIPKYTQSGKLKKEMLGDEFNLELKQNTDILKSLDKDGIFTIGFKAELDKQKAKDNALNMLKNKNLDAVCLNIIDENNPFGGDNNNIEILTNKDSYFIKGTKKDISFKILETFQREFND